MTTQTIDQTPRLILDALDFDTYSEGTNHELHVYGADDHLASVVLALTDVQLQALISNAVDALAVSGSQGAAALGRKLQAAIEA